MKQITISTPRLVLRVLSQIDAARMFEYRHDTAVRKYQSFQPASVKEVQEFISLNTTVFNIEGTWFQFGIFLNDKLIGDIGLHFLGPDNSQCEIGYTICPGQQRKGYGTEAVRHLVDFAFKTLRKTKIIAVIHPKNTASKALLENLGFSQDHELTHAEDIPYSISAETWESFA